MAKKKTNISDYKDRMDSPLGIVVTTPKRKATKKPGARKKGK